MSEPLIFEYESVARVGFAPEAAGESNLPEDALRTDELVMPRASELEVVRHFTRLSQLNFSIDTQFYPLGSCTMKYNPRVCNRRWPVRRVSSPEWR